MLSDEMISDEMLSGESEELLSSFCVSDEIDFVSDEIEHDMSLRVISQGSLTNYISRAVHVTRATCTRATCSMI
jgi:hypothetical protein